MSTSIRSRTSSLRDDHGDFTDPLYWRFWAAFEDQVSNRSWLTLQSRDFKPVGTMDMIVAGRLYWQQLHYAREVVRIIRQPRRGLWLPTQKLVNEVLVLADNRGLSLVERIGSHAHSA